jgi:hypothetical protein
VNLTEQNSFVTAAEDSVKAFLIVGFFLWSTYAIYTKRWSIIFDFLFIVFVFLDPISSMYRGDGGSRISFVIGLALALCPLPLFLILKKAFYHKPEEQTPNKAVHRDT